MIDLYPARDDIFSASFEALAALGFIKNAEPYNKFGAITGVQTADNDKLVWSGGTNYTFSSAETSYYISSSDNSDTQEITVELLDGNYNRTYVSVNLVGQTKTLLTTTGFRVNRAFNSDSSDFAGDVWIYEDDTVTAGVPQTDSKKRAHIDPRHQQTLMCIYTTPVNKEAFIPYGWLTMSRGSLSADIAADISFRIRQQGGTFLTKQFVSSKNAPYERPFKVPLLMPEKTDLVVRVDSVSANGAALSAGWDMILLDKFTAKTT